MENQVTVGAYRNSATLEIHSKQALRLVLGRSGDKDAEQKWQRYAVRGLRSFDRGAKQLDLQASTDLTVAKEALLSLSEKIAHAKRVLSHSTQEIATLIDHIPSRTKLTICASEKPAILSFQFESPYGFQVACLITQYDELVGQVETARRNGLINRKQADQCIYKTATGIRTVLSHPSRYKPQPASTTKDSVMHTQHSV